MTKHLALIFSITLLIFNTNAQAEEQSTLSDGERTVEFRGVSEEDIKMLKKKIPEISYSNPPQAALDEAIRELMRRDSYAGVRVEANSEHYIILGNPLRKVTEVVVTGNTGISEDEILNALNIKPGTFLDETHVSDAGERVKELYGKRGYFNTIIAYDFQSLGSSNIKVLINVKERSPCVVKSVVFNSDNTELNETLRKVASKYLKNNFTEESVTQIEQAVAEYLKDHRYINTQVLQKDANYNNAKTEVILTYDLTDPARYELLLSGQVDYTDGRIIQAIKLGDFTRGSHDVGLDISQLIRTFYYQNGYSQVQVFYREKFVQSENTKQLIIQITEGPRVRIDSISVTGHISRPAKYYSKFIEKHSSDTIEEHYYVKEDLENGYKNLMTELNNQGFLKAKIQSARADYSKKKDSVTIAVDIDEGPLTQLTQIRFAGVKSFSEDQLLSQMTIKSQTALHLNQLEESIGLLRDFYHNRGFLEMSILNSDQSLINYDEKGLKATIEFKIYEGPQVYVKSIALQGNTFTKDYVILKAVNIETGDLLTPNLIEEGRKRLENLHAFSKVELRTLEANTVVSQRTLVIDVTETNPGLFKIGAGITNKNQLTARGFSGVSYNNIAGTARAVSIYGTIESNLIHQNLLEYEVDLGYLEPFLFNSRFRGRANYSRSELLLDIDNTQLQATDRITFAVEKDITSHIKFSWLAWGRDSIVQYFVPSTGPLRRTSRIDIGYVGPVIEVEYRDNPFLPTRGSFFKADASYADPQIGSSETVQFYKVEGTASHYTRLLGSPKFVWANSVRSGYERNIDPLAGSGIPVSNAFFLGGYTTVRGYTGNGGDRIPSSTQFPLTSNFNQLVVPAESDYVLLKSEFRFSIRDPIGGVIFWDAGQVNVQNFHFTDPFKQSIGVGFRVNTPLGPISVDYGHKLNPETGQSNYAWHLFIGTF